MVEPTWITTILTLIGSLGVGWLGTIVAQFLSHRRTMAGSFVERSVSEKDNLTFVKDLLQGQIDALAAEGTECRRLYAISQGEIARLRSEIDRLKEVIKKLTDERAARRCVLIIDDSKMDRTMAYVAVESCADGDAIEIVPVRDIEAAERHLGRADLVVIDWNLGPDGPNNDEMVAFLSRIRKPIIIVTGSVDEVDPRAKSMAVVIDKTGAWMDTLSVELAKFSGQWTSTR